MNFDLKKVKRVHFIGIGGIGMSALARLFVHEKKEVSGSDREVTNITCGLEALGIKFADKQVPENITEDIDLVIYTEAMAEDHPELLEARKKNITTINYFGALGAVANQYYLIAVAGTHGKTTTTAMLIDIFEETGNDPTAIVGSLRSKTGSNFRAGKSKYFIAEACEYKRDFLHLEPDTLIVTNIETEHVDYYKDLEDVQAAFRELAEKVPEEGYVVCNATHPTIKPVIEGLKCTIVDYKQYVDPLLTLKQPGMHNHMNAAAAVAASELEGIKKDDAKKALTEFSGTWRRSEYKGKTKSGAEVYDDYGHHPTEIEATLKGIKEMHPKKKLTVVFESHTYSRTHKFLDEFVDALSLADEVVLVPIYAAREENVSGVSSEQIVDMLTKKGHVAKYVKTFEDAAKELDTKGEKDVVVTMGAGNIYQVAEALTK